MNGFKFFLFCILFLISTVAYSQSQTDEKETLKEEKKERKEYDKWREKAIENHYRIQSDRTKAQMKLSKKKSDMYRKKNKKGPVESFFLRRKQKKEKRKRSRKQKR